MNGVLNRFEIIMKVYNHLQKVLDEKGAGYLVLLDPDHENLVELSSRAKFLEDCGVDGILVGGSLLVSNHFDECIKVLKQSLSIPVIIFPGNGNQLSGYADAVLFLSLISGRNPHYLIEEQVRSAPVIKSLNLEPISTGYMLIESGRTTSVEYISNTRPIPNNKPEIAVAHALAAEFMGMKLIYLEAGSGASQPVPDKMIQAVSGSTSVPLIVGGGINNPQVAEQKVKAGASFIVTGDVIEKSKDDSLVSTFCKMIHSKE